MKQETEPVVTLQQETRNDFVEAAADDGELLDLHPFGEINGVLLHDGFGRGHHVAGIVMYGLVDEDAVFAEGQLRMAEV